MTKSSCALLLITVPLLGLAACGEVNTTSPGAPDAQPDGETSSDQPDAGPDANEPDARPDARPDAPRNVMFVTSTTMTGSFGGRDGADNTCKQLAAAANLPGIFRAYVSTTTENAPARLGTARGWVRTDG